MQLKKTKKREECEDAIVKHLLAISKIYNKYNPEGTYLSIYLSGAGCKDFVVNNAYMDDDIDAPIEFYVFDGKKGCVYG